MIRHSIILNLLVVAVVGIFLCGNSVDALNPKIEEDDVWIKLSRLADVKDLVDNGDVEGAKLVIDTFSEEFPEYITDDISSEGVKGGRVEIDNNILVDLKERWKKYLSVRQRQGVLDRWQSLREIREKIERFPVPPSFMNDFELEYGQLEKEVNGAVDHYHERTTEAVKILSGHGSLNTRLEKLSEIYYEYMKNYSTHEDLSTLEKVKELIQTKAENIARLIAAKSGILMEMYGCDHFVDYIDPFLPYLKNIVPDYHLRLNRQYEKCL